MPFRPKNASNACFRRSRRLIKLANESLTDKKIRSDLRRSALVMAVAAVDSYMHWLVYQRISIVRGKGDIPKALQKLDIPFKALGSLADTAIRARQQDKNIRPWVQVKDVVQKRLLRETFQSYEQIGDAFSMAGVDHGWSRTAKKLGIKTEEIKARLNKLINRRNQIVHEGDITRSLRPRRLKYNKVKSNSVTSNVNWVEKLIAAIEKVIYTNENERPLRGRVTNGRR